MMVFHFITTSHCYYYLIFTAAKLLLLLKPLLQLLLLLLLLTTPPPSLYESFRYVLVFSLVQELFLLSHAMNLVIMKGTNCRGKACRSLNQRPRLVI